jgi:protoporphyrinogen oxidase
VAIVGAGLSGLVSGFELAERGVDVTIFEKENCCGGRIRNIKIDGFTAPVGAIMFTPDYSHYVRLVEKLGFLNRIKRIPLSESALLVGREPVKLNRLSLAISSKLSVRTKLELRQLWRQLDSLTAWAFDQELLQVSLSEFLESRVSTDTIQSFIEPAINAFFQNPNQVAAAVGLQMLKSLSKVHVLEGGNAIVTEALAERLHGRVRFGHEIHRPTLNGSKWRVDSLGEFDYVICTTPLEQTRNLFPECQLTELSYAPVNVLVVRGEYRYKKYRIVIDSDWKETEIHSIKHFGSYQIVHAKTPSPNLTKYYGSYEIVAHVHWDSALPAMVPGAGFQGIESGLPRLFLAGDFYLGGRMESAVRAAHAAVDRILKMNRA